MGRGQRPGHIASYRKVGVKDVGVLRRYGRANDGRWRDSLLMDLLAEELLLQGRRG